MLLLILATHPIQYQAPVYRALQTQFDIPTTVIYVFCPGAVATALRIPAGAPSLPKHRILFTSADRTLDCHE